MATPSSPNEAALFDAVGAGDLEAVRRLLDAGADVNARDEYDSTPLHLSVNGAWGPEEADPVVRALIEAGADVNATTVRTDAPPAGGCTPLMDAAYEGDPSQVRLLLDAGADPNAVSHGGWTALTFATQGTAPYEKISMLLGAGADAKVRDSEGLTAVDWALEGQQRAAHSEVPESRDVVKLLQESLRRRG